MKLRRVRITENSEQDAAEFVILPGLREPGPQRWDKEVDSFGE